MTVLKHSGFHEVVRGERYNPACLACKLEEEKAGVGIITCPLGRPKWQRNCVACSRCDEGMCAYLTEEELKALAEERDKKRLELEKVLRQELPNV